MKKYNIGVVGATGAVGEEILKVLEEQDFPINNITPIASSNSAGQKVEAFGKKWVVQELTEDVFKKNEIEIAFFSAGGEISAKYAKYALNDGAIVIDNTSHFRMEEDIPLVVPQVNPQDIELCKNGGIIANPNCSTIQMVQVLHPLHKKYNIERVDVSTYQAVSGAGKKGMEELVNQMHKFFAFELDSQEAEVFPHRIALNLIPHIDKFMPNDYTKEEMKMVNETNKIMHSDFQISATCVRVPVLRSHSEAITIRFTEEVDAEEVKDILENTKDLILLDNISQNLYPMPSIATDTDETYVGRIRVDNFDKKILHLWCVADQIRVGAATNAVKIAQEWIKGR